MSTKKFLIFVIAIFLIFPATNVYGHGLGIDTISSINVEGKSISISVEIPMYFAKVDSQQITITATDDESNQTAKNITFLIGLFHQNEMILRNYFFADNGILVIKVKPTTEGEVEIHGEQDSLLGAWHGTELNPIEITGPIFNSGGLYNFEIEVRTIDEPTNIIEDSSVYYADLSIVETTEYLQEDSLGNEVKFRLKSYFDKISNLEYNPENKIVSFEMPFDWSEKQVSHIPVIHEEVHFPKDFAEFLYPSYTGKVNGIDLFKASVTIDDYTEDDERIVHFVLLQDHLKYIKNQMKKSDEPLPDKMIFTLLASDKPGFPLTAYTKSEDFQVDLSWDPLEIQPGVKTNFIFTIRDGATGEPIRNSDYTFVIIQNGNEIHRATGTAQVGGDFKQYKFGEEQTGPTIIRFENIRNTGQETEFGFVVAPEFGSITMLILIISVIGVIFVTRRNSFALKTNF
ncbi:MAG: PEFG-CTERM sorting domain-containing protein [Nitrosopumilus sp.]|nr:PEFG-CTERM sorting domain-containing protein [Nitrosopumilus sp.]MDH3501844.1 PEFG-CTERM sorting domain-containing protein [Nitrosopumilus sp.]